MDKDLSITPKVGVSACLLGQAVRYDAGHKRDAYVVDVLAPHFDLVPVCPEVEAGMGVPREPVRLVDGPASPRMVGRESSADWTIRMNAFCRQRTGKRDVAGLDGYILKKNSPSCGMERVKVYSGGTAAQRSGRGLFAAALMQRYSLLPVEEEGRLCDHRLRESFIERVFAHHRLRLLMGSRFDRGRLVKFHTTEKYLILSHSPRHYTLLGRLVAAAKRFPPAELRDRYAALYMEALAVKTTAGKNINVMMHILGFFKERLAAAEKADLLQVIEDYRGGLIPLVVPLTLLKHYVRKFDIEYVRDQVYLNPHPKELMLRNHV
jgi:uncharacterized protein YbgA (DUF1722 family)/uncharacterized protein YbbK (DUF523 family)